MRRPIPCLALAAALAAALFLSGCGVNPVTGKSEIQLIGEATEIRMGEQNYAPTRQIEGGDYRVDPDLTRYVQQVGDRLAAVSDRPLPYEFTVLNNSVPNAWALPGGKIAVNRGLLMELQSEAELAAVLGHEIVHAAARHTAKAQERGMLLQGGILATTVLAQDSVYADLIAGGAAVGAQMISTRYGRDAELESDYYGMKYMARAGYDPMAAVQLQETFVRLSEGKKSNWLAGLFASHPPSAERVEANRKTALELGGDQGEWGREAYQKAMAQLLRDKPAYTAQDEAIAAAGKRDYPKALKLIDTAIGLQPREASFHGVKGDILLDQRKYENAVANYDRAINYDPYYFGYYLNRGLAYKELGDRTLARESLEQANSLLPTPLATKQLGDLSLAEGNRAQAMEYYSAAAGSDSPAGQAARASLAKLDLPANPARYLQVAVRQDAQGRIVLVVGNRSPVAVANVVVEAAYFDEAGRQLSQVMRFGLDTELPSGQAAPIYTRLTNPQGLRAAVSRAEVWE